MKSKLVEYMESSTVARQFSYKVELDAKSEKIRRYAPFILLLVMTAVCAASQKSFFTWNNIINLMYQMSIPLVISVGLTYVLLLGSIDLSIEGVMGFGGSLVAYLVMNRTNGNNFGIWGILIVVALCTLVGAITGILHVKARIASFIVTYAVGCIMIGVSVLIYNSNPIQVTEPMFETISKGKFLQIPYITIISFLIFAVGAVILRYTAFGRAVYAIGDNEIATRSAGINVDLVKIKVFSLCACTACLAGILQCVRLKIGQSSLGTDQMFPVVTAIVVGGGSLYGGKGGAFQSFTGVLIYTELANWLTLMGVDPYFKDVILGLIIIIAVTLTIERNRQTISK